MAESEPEFALRRCAQCGAELTGKMPTDLCPKCLLQAGLEPPPLVGAGGTVVLPKPEGSTRGLPQTGERLGHYAITRLLGTGGMGAVFEAEDLENGRRVALKVLSHTLDSPDARERFFREGRLAASINHPNSVYIYGTEEIGGTPVIAMELVAAGTLQDRVHARGPLPPSHAVDCVLQIIAGLEAAQRIGVLHRDVKPSNCFISAENTVKIGDFGLSISTAVRVEPALTATGAFLGTPAFCSPEQLRGEELNARSDMYSVGATLFYLLTGRTPFEAKHMVQLLATVLEQRAPSPKRFRPDLPQGLAKVVLRCLEKQPGERFKSYGELAHALAPYGSAAPTPATLGLRFLAGLFDVLLLNGTVTVIVMFGLGGSMSFLNLMGQRSPKAYILMFAWLPAALAYYGICEGLWGAAAGKALCRLRVVKPDHSPPGFWRASLRALIFVGLPVMPYWMVYPTGPKAYADSSMILQTCLGFTVYIVLALLFSTARRRNSFAAVHDLATKTRVISRLALEARPVLALVETPPSAATDAPAIGPYHVLEPLGQSAEAEWLLGYDLRLLRRVWIRCVSPSAPAVGATLRNLGRVGRLRWLAGRRSAEENWDVYEAVPGKPLLQLLHTPQPWNQVRFWLSDLATELATAEKNATLPGLALDRVWIAADGRAKLLDVPAPGATTAECAPPVCGETRNLSPQRFIAAVAAAALTGRADAAGAAVGDVAVPLPLHARKFLQDESHWAGPDAIVNALKPLLQRVAWVSRWRRAAVVGGCLAVPLLSYILLLFGTAFTRQFERSNPGLFELSGVLQKRSMMNYVWMRKYPHPTDRQFAIYIASHFQATITNGVSWTNLFSLAIIKGEARQFAEQSLVQYPAPTAEEVADAEAAMNPGRVALARMVFTNGAASYFPESTNAAAQAAAPPSHPSLSGGPRRWDTKAMPSLRQVGFMPVGAFMVFVGLPALVAALAFRGGLVLLIAGFTFVRKDGVRASRLRVFWRALVAWVPVLLVAAAVSSFLMPAPMRGVSAIALPAMALLAGLGAISLALSERGLPDRLAGTWPVPR